MATTEDIRRALQSVPMPPCAELTPFELVDIDPAGRVRVRFAPQPAVV